jgi:hypothetical protein
MHVIVLAFKIQYLIYLHIRQTKIIDVSIQYDCIAKRCRTLARLLTVCCSPPFVERFKTDRVSTVLLIVHSSFWTASVVGRGIGALDARSHADMRLELVA